MGLSGVQERNIQGAHLLPTGDALANLFYMGTVRLDACGNSDWAIDKLSHHSVEPAENGTFWISGGSQTPPPESERSWNIPAIEGPIFHDRILQVSEAGQILRDIHGLEVLFSNDLEHLM